MRVLALSVLYLSIGRHFSSSGHHYIGSTTVLPDTMSIRLCNYCYLAQCCYASLSTMNSVSNHAQLLTHSLNDAIHPEKEVTKHSFRNDFGCRDW